MYFPTEKMIYKDARDREIVSEYNGFNHKELAAKYNMSESYIRAIINRHKKRNYTPESFVTIYMMKVQMVIYKY